MNTVIEVVNLTKCYGNFLAVDHINFNVREGEIFGFLDPNGAGKATTQRMLTTLLEPTSGQVTIFGHDLARDAYPAKRQIGLVPEESNVYAELTAWDNLIFTARLYRMPRAAREARAQELLETFDLWEKRDVKVETFSKGIRRRLSIAMAIIHRPRLLFLDEPTPGLDARSARTIHGMIRKMNAEGMTIFLTTHQIEEANMLCDRVAIINQGQIAAIDTPERLKLAFRKVQSVEVALEPNGQAHGQTLTTLPGVTTSVKMGDKWRLGTYDRLLAASMSLLTLLLGKTAVGALYAISTSAFALLVGILAFGSQVARPRLLAASIALASFSALGLIFGSIPTRDPGAVQMPSTLLRWGLLFISGVFIPLPEMSWLARAVAYLSPLTYAQDLMNYAVMGQGLLNLWLDLAVLLLSGLLFLASSAWMHRRSRRLGY